MNATGLLLLGVQKLFNEAYECLEQHRTRSPACNVQLGLLFLSSVSPFLDRVACSVSYMVAGPRARQVGLVGSVLSILELDLH